MVLIEIREPDVIVGEGVRRRVSYKRLGLLGLYASNIQSRDDFLCAPHFDSFSLELARSVAQLRKTNATEGFVGDLRWRVCSIW